MKYKCLVFDHDDTTVNSTATIHHPCFQQYLDEFYPGRKITLEDYFIKNFTPGFVEMCEEEYAMGKKELEHETRYRNEYVSSHIPEAYAGIREIMLRQKDQGGIVCVVSHSFAHNIRRDFRHNHLPEPDCIFGWELPPERRKPSPWALEEIMRQFSLRPEDILVIDDLKPGYEMAKKCGADFAAAGWAHDVTFIENFMRENCDNYFKTVEELNSFLVE